MNLDETPTQGLNTKLENKLTWRSFYDGRSRNISDNYGIFGIPTVIVIDHEGKIQWIGHNFNDALVDSLIAAIE